MDVHIDGNTSPQKSVGILPFPLPTETWSEVCCKMKGYFLGDLFCIYAVSLGSFSVCFLHWWEGVPRTIPIYNRDFSTSGEWINGCIIRCYESSLYMIKKRRTIIYFKHLLGCVRRTFHREIQHTHIHSPQILFVFLFLPLWGSTTQFLEK